MMNDILDDILYEDKEMILLHKPGGIAVQTARLGQKDLVSMLKNYRAGKNEDPYIGVVHRLDQPVEGVILFAKTKEAAASFSRQFQSHQTDKCYCALVCCNKERPFATGEKAVLTDYLIKDPKSNTSKVVKQGSPGAKKAVLDYRVLQTAGSLAELLIRLETGRHHQIRVQLAHAGMPLAGDVKYAGEDSMALTERYTGVRQAYQNLPLCSVKICFFHPKTGEKMEFETKPKHKLFQLLYE